MQQNCNDNAALQNSEVHFEVEQKGTVSGNVTGKGQSPAQCNSLHRRGDRASVWL